MTAFPGRGSVYPSVPFIGLVEGMVLAAIRRSGVPLQRIRPALDALAKEIGVTHALASKRLYTDGAEVLFDFAEHEADDERVSTALKDLVVIRSGQHVFTDVVSEYLKRISYDPKDKFARMIRLPEYERAEVLVGSGQILRPANLRIRRRTCVRCHGSLLGGRGPGRVGGRLRRA